MSVAAITCCAGPANTMGLPMAAANGNMVERMSLLFMAPPFLFRPGRCLIDSLFGPHAQAKLAKHVRAVSGNSSPEITHLLQGYGRSFTSLFVSRLSLHYAY